MSPRLGVVGPASVREGLPRLHVVTDDRVLADPGFPRLADRVLTAGGRDVALHLRGPRTSGRRLFLLVDRVRPAVRREGSLLLVNDRVDLALTAGVHGVHLGRRSLPPHPVRGLLGADPWIGLSVHSEDEVGTGEEADVDYLLAGTIFATPSHPDRPGSGPELLAAIRERTSLPLLAIGGVTPERVHEVLGTGALGVAVLRGVWEDPDPARAVERYLAALEGPGNEPPESASDEPEGAVGRIEDSEDVGGGPGAGEAADGPAEAGEGTGAETTRRQA